MEMSPLQRRLTFGLIVLVLAGLAMYLVDSAARGSGSPPRPARASGATSPAPIPSAPAPTSSASVAPSAGGGPDIYQWLPFTEAGLATAASVAERFAAAYGTFSYTESATAYAAPLRQLSSASLAEQVEAAYSLPGVAAARTNTRQVSTGTAAIESIRAFGPGSITFIVDITEHQSATTGSGDAMTSYAMTLSGNGSSWQVTDIELSDLGNS